MVMASGQTNTWHYTTTTIDVTENHSYGDYRAFNTAYIENLVSGIPGCIVKIVFEDNTSAARAGQWHIGVYINGVERGGMGKRVGGSFVDAYGCDVYAGAKIHIDISIDASDGIAQ